MKLVSIDIGAPIFKVLSSTRMDVPPSIKVSFPSGAEDVLELTYYMLQEGSNRSCNYLGHLRNTPFSSAAVTGCLNKHGDKMEITLISEHNSNMMFTVDFDGNTEIIRNPFQDGGMLRSMNYITTQNV